MNSKQGERRVLIVAGESSGDLHGANLIRAAREVDPGLAFFGIAGKRMAEAGCEVRFPAESLAVMGLVEVLLHLPTIRRAYRLITQWLLGPEKPDLVVLIDYPGFNLRVARAAKRAGIPVLYYISPKVWAWKKGRAAKVARYVDHLAVIFPFEPKCYAGYDLPVTYVGNPLLDGFSVGESREAFRRRHGLNLDAPLVALFPGSRRSEIRYSFDKIVQAARVIRERLPQAQFVMSLADALDQDEIARRLAGAGMEITTVSESVYDLAHASDAAIAVSGTVTLQIALTGTPMVVTYSASPLTFAVYRCVIRIPHVGLVNIVAEREVVRELLQDEATPVNLAAEIVHILQDDAYRRSMVEGLQEVIEALGEPGCASRVARIAAELAGITD